MSEQMRTSRWINEKSNTKLVKLFLGLRQGVVHHINESFIILLHLLSFSLNVILTINANWFRIFL